MPAACFRLRKDAPLTEPCGLRSWRKALLAEGDGVAGFRRTDMLRLSLKEPASASIFDEDEIEGRRLRRLR